MAPEREPATPSRCPSNRGSRMDGNYLILLAESEGFEPPIPLRVLLISNQVPSAARPALRSDRGLPPRPAGKALGDPTPPPAHSAPPRRSALRSSASASTLCRE